MRALALVALTAFLAASPSTGQTLKPDQVLSSISVRPLSEPNPVLGADGRVHLAYELLVANPTDDYVTIDRLEAVDASGRTLLSLAADDLARMTKIFTAWTTGSLLVGSRTSSWT